MHKLKVSLSQNMPESPPSRSVTFMDYDLGYFDNESRRLEPLANPFCPRLLPMSSEGDGGKALAANIQALWHLQSTLEKIIYFTVPP